MSLPRRSPCLWWIAAVTLCTTRLWAVEDEKAAQQRAATGQASPTKGVEMQYGPVLMCSVRAQSASGMLPVAAKGTIIKLGEHDEGYVCFDTDTLRLATAWTGGFANLKWANIGSYKGDKLGAVEVAGTPLWRMAEGPGWSRVAEGPDPRATGAGPLPRDIGRFRGFYLHGQLVVLSYEAEGCGFLETTELATIGDAPALVRRFTAEASAAPLYLRNVEGSSAGLGLWAFGDPFPAEGVRLPADQHGSLVLPPHAGRVNFTVVYSTAPPERAAQVAAVAGSTVDLHTLTAPSVPRWPETITLAGQRAHDDAAYVVDTVPLPVDNPWKSWMRLSALDFFPDGRAAVATLNGDVWIVSGLDDTLSHVSWKRYAVGLYEPLGLKIVDGLIYVHGRDQITRLHDSNGDGEADFYECFNSDRTLYPSYHAFAFDLQTDSRGNFYYVVGGNQLGLQRPSHAALFRVSPDGQKTETVATGFRAPNGMAIGPHDEIAVGDNQGHWIPSSKINLIRPGGFYGHVADPRVDPKAVAPPSFDQPLCWIPMTMDNSSGGEVWATGGRWGPYDGHLLHTSYGKSALLAVLSGEAGGVPQGGVVPFPLKLASGIMRARMNPHDGQLYVAGLRGWQTNAVADGCLQRVRYTGEPLYLPTGLQVRKDALEISFSVPLDQVAASDPGNFSAVQYNYKWWSTYGSPDLSVANPEKKGRDPVEITAATLSADRKTVRLSVPGLRPVMQMEVQLQLRAADGHEIKTTLAQTIHQVPEK